MKYGLSELNRAGTWICNLLHSSLPLAFRKKCRAAVQTLLKDVVVPYKLHYFLHRRQGERSRYNEATLFVRESKLRFYFGDGGGWGVGGCTNLRALTGITLWHGLLLIHLTRLNVILPSGSCITHWGSLQFTYFFERINGIAFSPKKSCLFANLHWADDVSIRAVCGGKKCSVSV